MCIKFNIILLTLQNLYNNYLQLTKQYSMTPQDTNCTATYPLSRKLFKLDEPDMQDTAGEAGTNS